MTLDAPGDTAAWLHDRRQRREIITPLPAAVAPKTEAEAERSLGGD